MAIRRRLMSYGATSVRHRRGRRGAEPVFLAGGEADDIAGADFLDNWPKQFHRRKQRQPRTDWPELSVLC